MFPALDLLLAKKKKIIIKKNKIKTRIFAISFV
jgi:hypothetical protein